MTPKELKQIKERCEAATEGPWLRHENVEDMFTVFVMDTSIAETAGCNLLNKQKLLNADFIEHARTDIPALIDEVSRLRGFAQDWEGHENDCDYLDEGSPCTACTCGYEKAREQALEQP